jgi:hypothetical protein
MNRLVNHQGSQSCINRLCAYHPDSARPDLQVTDLAITAATTPSLANSHIAPLSLGDAGLTRKAYTSMMSNKFHERTTPGLQRHEDLAAYRSRKLLAVYETAHRSQSAMAAHRRHVEPYSASLQMPWMPVAPGRSTWFCHQSYHRFDISRNAPPTTGQGQSTRRRRRLV